jgi:hypothetical protein
MHTRELNSQAFGVKNITEPRKPLNQTDILPKGFLIVLNLKIFVPDMTPEPYTALVRCLERKNFLLSTKESPYKY